MRHESRGCDVHVICATWLRSNVLDFLKAASLSTNDFSFYPLGELKEHLFSCNLP